MSTKQQQIEFLRSSLNAGKWVRGVLFFQSKILSSCKGITSPTLSFDDNTDNSNDMIAETHLINATAILMPEVLRRGLWLSALHILQQTGSILPAEDKTRYVSAIRRISVTDPVRVLHELESTYSSSNNNVSISMFDRGGSVPDTQPNLADYDNPTSTDSLLHAKLLPLNMATTTRINVLNALKSQSNNNSNTISNLPVTPENLTKTFALDLLSSSSYICSFLPWKYVVKMFATVHFPRTKLGDDVESQSTASIGSSGLYSLSHVDNYDDSFEEENDLLLSDNHQEMFHEFNNKGRSQQRGRMKYTNDAEVTSMSSWLHLSDETIRQSIEQNTLPSLLMSLCLALGYPTGEWDESITAAESDSFLSSSVGSFATLNSSTSSFGGVFSISAMSVQKSPYHGNIPNSMAGLRAVIHERVVDPVFDFLIGRLYRSQRDHVNVNEETSSTKNEIPFFLYQLTKVFQQTPNACTGTDGVMMNVDIPNGNLSLTLRSLSTTFECLELLVELEAGRLRDAVSLNNNKSIAQKAGDYDHRGLSSRNEDTTHKLIILLSRIQTAVKRIFKPLHDGSTCSTSTYIHHLLGEKLYRLERAVVRSLASTLSCMRGTWAESLCIASASTSSLLQEFVNDSSNGMSRANRLISHSVVHSLSTLSTSSSSNHFQVLRLLLDKIEKRSKSQSVNYPFVSERLLTSLTNRNGLGCGVSYTSSGDVKIVDSLLGGDFWRLPTQEKDEESLLIDAKRNTISHDKHSAVSTTINPTLLLTPSQRKVLLNMLYPRSLLQSDIVRNHYGEKLKHIPRYYHGEAWKFAMTVLMGSLHGNTNRTDSMTAEGQFIYPLEQQHPSAFLPHRKLPLEALKVLVLCCYGGAPANIFTELQKNVFFPRRSPLHKMLPVKNQSDDNVASFGVDSIYCKGAIPNESVSMALERKNGKCRISREQYRRLCFYASDAVQAAKTHPIAWTGWRCALEVACGVMLLDVPTRAEKEKFRHYLITGPTLTSQEPSSSMRKTCDINDNKRTTDGHQTEVLDKQDTSHVSHEVILEGPQLQLCHAICGLLNYRGLAGGNTMNRFNIDITATPTNTPPKGILRPHQWQRALEHYASLCSNKY